MCIIRDRQYAEINQQYAYHFSDRMTDTVKSRLSSPAAGCAVVCKTRTGTLVSTDTENFHFTAGSSFTFVPHFSLDFLFSGLVLFARKQLICTAEVKRTPPRSIGTAS